MRAALEWAAILATAVACVALPAAGAALIDDPDPLERIPTTVTLNGVERGELFAWRDGLAFWVDLRDLERLGIPIGGIETREISGRPHARLDRLDGVTAALDEASLALAIEVEPWRLPQQEVDLARTEDLPITPSSGVSGFLDAAISADRSSESGTAYEARLLGNIAAAGWLARSEHQMTRAPGVSQDYRLRTFAQRDWAPEMLRLVIGDFDASAGLFSRTTSLAGISFGRAFDLRPGFVSAPTARLSGVATAPSTAEIYIDGLLVATRPLMPGPYDFTNLQDFGGLRTVEVVVRDASGVRERMRIPFYFTERLLSEGLTDFNASWGAQREGAFSDTYGAGAFSGYWLHGVTDALTLGVQGQRSSGYAFGALVVGARLGSLGVVGANLAARRVGDGETRRAAFASYSYTRGATTLRLQGRAFEEGFQETLDTIGGPIASPSSEVSAGWDQNFGRRFLLSLTATDRRFRVPGADEREYGASLSISLSGSANITLVALNRRSARSSITEGGVNFSASLGANYRTNAGWRRDAAGSDTYTAQFGRNEPEGEGIGWRAFAQDSPGARDVQGDLSWKFRHGVLNASARQTRLDSGRVDGERVSLEAALACVGSSCYVTRPVDESFAVVDLNGVEGVRVSRNNEMIGRTNRAGEVVIASAPALTQNLIEIDDGDVPISIEVPTNQQSLVPAQGVGYRVRFDLRRIASVVGTLSRGGRPLENIEFVLNVPGAPLRTLRTGRDGRFQVDSIGAGRYPVSVELEDGTCIAWLDVPDAREPVTSLGEVRCAMAENF